MSEAMVSGADVVSLEGLAGDVPGALIIQIETDAAMRSRT